MKTIALLLTSLCATAAFGQSISYVPRQFAAFVSSDGTGNPGTWNPLTGTGGTAISFVPQPIGIYYSTDGTGNPGTWAPWKGGASGTISSITSTGSTISITGGTGPTTNVDLNLAHANTWTATQTFGTATGNVAQFSVYDTGTNCSSAASPAVCAAASAGSVAVAAGTNPTLTVNTTRVTANSQILLQEDQSLGARLSVTCQTAVDPTFTKVTARTAGTSFTFQITGTFTTNPVCYSYTIIN